MSQFRAWTLENTVLVRTSGSAPEWSDLGHRWTFQGHSILQKDGYIRSFPPRVLVRKSPTPSFAQHIHIHLILILIFTSEFKISVFFSKFILKGSVTS